MGGLIAEQHGRRKSWAVYFALPDSRTADALALFASKQTAD
jgi:hypothetical protein